MSTGGDEVVLVVDIRGAEGGARGGAAAAGAGGDADRGEGVAPDQNFREAANKEATQRVIVAESAISGKKYISEGLRAGALFDRMMAERGIETGDAGQRIMYGLEQMPGTSSLTRTARRVAGGVMAGRAVAAAGTALPSAAAAVGAAGLAPLAAAAAPAAVALVTFATAVAAGTRALEGMVSTIEGSGLFRALMTEQEARRRIAAEARARELMPVLRPAIQAQTEADIAMADMQAEYNQFMFNTFGEAKVFMQEVREFIARVLEWFFENIENIGWAFKGIGRQLLAIPRWWMEASGFMKPGVNEKELQLHALSPYTDINQPADEPEIFMP